MVKNAKPKSKEKSMLNKVVVGIVVSIVCGLIFAVVLTSLALGGNVPFEMANIMITAAHFVAVLLGGLSAVIGKEKSGLLMPLFITAGYLLVLLCVNILFLDTGVKITAFDVLGVAAAAGVAVIAGIFRDRGVRSRKFRR